MSNLTGNALRDRLGMQTSSSIKEVRENANAALFEFARLERELAEMRQWRDEERRAYLGASSHRDRLLDVEQYAVLLREVVAKAVKHPSWFARTDEESILQSIVEGNPPGQYAALANNLNSSGHTAEDPAPQRAATTGFATETSSVPEGLGPFEMKTVTGAGTRAVMNGEPVMFRFRTDWRGRVILQALIRSMEGSVALPGEMGHGYGFWRDARAQDISRSPHTLPTTPGKY